MARTAKSSNKSSDTQRRSKGRRKIKTEDSGPAVKPNTKTALLIEMLSRPEGASLADLMKKTKWQPHSIRGAISGTLKKKLGLPVTSEVDEDRGRVYRITKSA